MDDIAAAAKVSKQTIYTHFSSKEELFAELVLGNAARVEVFVAGIPGTLVGARTFEAGLRRLARDYLGFVVRPDVLRLRRLIIGEAARFPDLAQSYYAQVPGRVYGALADEFRRLGVKEPATAAQHFAWLTLGLPLDRGMFYPVESATAGADLDRLAASAVRVFLAAYRVA
jgi:TetR/AcrR family transcriptional regulator, mexJK operon transcriptional repressor